MNVLYDTAKYMNVVLADDLSVVYGVSMCYI